MLKQTKRISFRISSVLSKVEPEPEPDLHTGSDQNVPAPSPQHGIPLHPTLTTTTQDTKDNSSPYNALQILRPVYATPHHTNMWFFSKCCYQGAVKYHHLDHVPMLSWWWHYSGVIYRLWKQKNSLFTMRPCYKICTCAVYVMYKLQTKKGFENDY